VLTSSDQEEVSYLVLLRNTQFLRLFLAQTVSSLGDWIGVIAIAAVAYELNEELGVGLVMTARVLPGFIAGPIAGVLADRWDRRRLMVGADLVRAAVIFSLPFVPNLLYLLVASVVLESMTLVWGPAKDASLPHVVPSAHLTRANSLNLIAVYAPWPVASLVYAFMSTLGLFLGRNVPALKGLTDNPEAMALWLDSITFCFSAFMIWTLKLPQSRHPDTRMDLSSVKRDLVEGLQFVVAHKQVRPWLLGIAFTFMAAGGVFSLGPGFVGEVLGGGDRGFALLIGFLATGMIIGLIAIGPLAQRIKKDILFSSAILLAGIGLIALASMGSLNAAIPIASALGFFGGAAYSMGYSLMHETTEDEMRGRTFSAAYTVIRVGTLLGLGLFPLISTVISAAVDDFAIGLPWGGDLDLQGQRITLWIAGLVAAGGGVLSMRAIGAEGRRLARHPGTFVVFEGGEGAGKSTQMAAFVDWLQARGEDIVVTREPGGTSIGERIREVLLDPAASEMDRRTEALLYAADRAQHVAEVIKPALESGKVVVSDRFVDSSLAYQGFARGLGIEDIYSISEWATGGLLPDLVFFLNVDADQGLRRAEGHLDRIENEGRDFHDVVAAAYMKLVQRWPDRFVVIDASRSKSEVHTDVVKAYETREAAITPPQPSAAHDLGPPGTPVPR
jgi:dTMP kinase